MEEWISIDPATGQSFARRQVLDADGVEAALDQAADAFARWRWTPVAERAQLLLEAARILETDRMKLAALMSREMGKPFREAVAEVQKCAWACRWYAEAGPRLLDDLPGESDGSAAFVRVAPLGLILAIMPWNFPLWQVFRFAAPTLLAGNVVLVKHAPSVGQTAAALAAVWRRAGALAGVYTDLAIDVEATGRLVDDPRIAGVTVTGSTRAGRAVAERAGRALKPVVLELGGSDPFIVMPSADMAAAVEVGVGSRCQNNGQSCVAAKRFILHEAIAEDFTKRLVARMASLVLGDPMDEGVDLGPLARRDLRDTLTRQVRATLDAGGRALVGGAPLDGPGFFYPPTVLTDIPMGTPARDEEFFGPVASLFPVPDRDAAVALANDTPYGLGASVWTEDEDEATWFIDRLDAGAVFVNGPVKSDPRLPFGGVKASGHGRELGQHGLLAFTNLKTVWRR